MTSTRTQGPRVSVNKLGQYVRARTPARRRTIVEDQKHPPDFKTLWYRDARMIARDFIVDGLGDVQGLRTRAAELAARLGDTQPDKAARLQAEALFALGEMVDGFDVDGLELEVGPDRAEKLVIEGVEVSVQPDVLLRDPRTNRIGALKLHFAKTDDLQLDQEAGLDVAALVRWYVEKHMPHAACDPKLCQAVDVFGGHVYLAPKAVKRQRDQIEAALREYAMWWNAV